MEIVEGYVIILNFALILGSALLCIFFLFSGERELFRPMALERALLLTITLYSIFADHIWKSSEHWRFLIEPPVRPAIYRTPIVLGIWIVIVALWKWRKTNNKANG